MLSLKKLAFVPSISLGDMGKDDQEITRAKPLLAGLINFFPKKKITNLSVVTRNDDISQKAFLNIQTSKDY